jgi:hypothetical protein
VRPAGAGSQPQVPGGELALLGRAGPALAAATGADTVAAVARELLRGRSPFRGGGHPVFFKDLFLRFALKAMVF